MKSGLKIPNDWTFERSDVALAFDRHVREQLPWYDLATGAVAHLARHYVSAGGLVYDIGASTGNIGKSIAPMIEARKARLVAIESSADMVKRYSGPGEIVHADAMTYPFEEFDCAVVFLVLMFMPPAARLGWLSSLLGKVKPGGCVIVFDKVNRSSSPYLATVLRRLTLAGKVSTGTPADDIVAKELSISGVQRPIESRDLEALPLPCRPVFQFGEFSGYVFERPEGKP